MASARETALKIVYGVLEEGGYLNIVFQNQLVKQTLSREDRALVKELSFGVITHKITLDFIISSFSKVKMRKLSPYILNILRLGVYQLKFMDKIPVSAAVNESVKLAKRYGHNASSGFVNAVLRNVARSGAVQYPDREAGLAEHLSVRYSHPIELVDFYLDTFGQSFAEELLAANNQTPAISLRSNPLKTTREALIERLGQEGTAAKESGLSEYGVVLEGGSGIEALSAYREGLFTVQGESSQLAALALAPAPGDTVLDMCAAPGGKTTHIAELMENRGTVWAFDCYEKRLSFVRKAAARLGIRIIQTKPLDASVFQPEFEGTADKVLLDVPCSGLGIIRKKPDIKYKERLTDFEDLVTIQKNILNICSKYLKIEGELVYSTCTVNPAENMGVIEAFLETHPDFSLVRAASPKMGAAAAKELEKGFVTLYPNVHGCDGFFICKLKRRRG